MRYLLILFTCISFGQFNPIFFGSGLGSDPDANAFIIAAGITDAGQKTAINKLVSGLKNKGIWSKMHFIYPFVGGNSTAHKFNLKDPRDLDAAYRLTFVSSTHDSNGVHSSSADTHYNPSVSATLGSTHWSIYSRANTSASYRLVEVTNVIGMQMYTVSGGLFINDMYNDGGSAGARTTASNSNGIGYFLASKVTDPRTALHINGSLVGSETGAVTGSLPNGSLPIDFGNNTAFATMGLGLTDTEATDLYNLIQAFQTALGRQI